MRATVPAANLADLLSQRQRDVTGTALGQAHAFVARAEGLQVPRLLSGVLLE